jgi:hypothetical protein
VLIGSLLLMGLLVCGYTFARNMASFVALASAISLLRFAGSTARAALIASVYRDVNRVRIRAPMRVVTNVSVGAGALLGAIALTIGSPRAFESTVIIVGLLTSLSAVPLLAKAARQALSVPGEGRRGGASPERRSPPSPVFRPPVSQYPFFVGVYAMYFAVIDVGMPLWVIRQIAATRWFPCSWQRTQ